MLQRRRELILIFILPILLCACRFDAAPPSPTPVLQPTFTATIPFIPTLTALPPSALTPTPIPLPTVSEPVSTLAPDQPWLAYLTDKGLAVLNQDGTGQTKFVESGRDDSDQGLGCNFSTPFSETDSSVRAGMFPDMELFRRIGILYKAAYFVRPPDTMYIRRCGSFVFSGKDDNGLLAYIEWAHDEDMPELVIYEFLGGRVRDRFPLYQCPVDGNCLKEPVGRGSLAWSPDGRYLAFPAIWGELSSDLYLYDSQDHSTRQLTSGPEFVSEISWSPDGKWIIMGEVSASRPNNSGYTTSLLAISPMSGEAHLLYDVDHPALQHILGWLDDKRFLSYDGDGLWEGANIRLVDMSGGAKSLFSSLFYQVELDKVHGIVGVYAKLSKKYDQGMYLVSIESGEIIPVDDFDQFLWNDALGLFVSPTSPCKDDPTKLKALTTDGKVQCVSPVKPALPEYSPAPDGSWQLVWQKEILLLQASDQTTRYVTNAPVTQLIWCQDSSCFFYIANQVLYRVSVSDLTTQRVDEQLKKDEIMYQWLNARN